MTTPLPRRPGRSARVRVQEYGASPSRREDRVAVEEPLEIRVVARGESARSIAVVMRTPGHDFELAAGWLVNEGVIGRDTIRSVAYCTDDSLRREQELNVVTVEVDALPTELPARRLVDSACGVCGADAVGAVAGPPAADFTVSETVLHGLPARMREAQQLFARTGGVHGAALADTGGRFSVVREDVGRHNALDKAIGHHLLSQTPMPPIAVLSGRVGFDLMQKSVASGITMLVAVGAPTSLAVDLAERTGRSLVGFTGERRFVAYAGQQRIVEA